MSGYGCGEWLKKSTMLCSDLLLMMMKKPICQQGDGGNVNEQLVTFEK